MRVTKIYEVGDSFIVTQDSYINVHGNETIETNEDSTVHTDFKSLLNKLVEELYEPEDGTSSYDYKVELINTKNYDVTDTIIVTRHKALIQYLQEVLWLSDKNPVIEHATEEDVKGKHVFGVLPLHLACHAASVIEIPLEVPLELRGKELSLEQLKQYAKPAREYRVKLVNND